MRSPARVNEEHEKGLVTAATPYLARIPDEKMLHGSEDMRQMPWTEKREWLTEMARNCFQEKGLHS